MGKKVFVSGRGKVTTYGWMYKSAKFALENAEKSKKGQFFNVMSSLIFCAFMIEAYFNHLGNERFDAWDNIERKLSKRGKLKKILADLHLSVGYQSRPYSSILEVFDFRDTLAHGKTETVEKGFEADFEHATSGQIMILNDWMEFCTLENARRTFEDATHVVEKLHKAAGLGKHPFLSFHSSVYEVRELGSANDA